MYCANNPVQSATKCKTDKPRPENQLVFSGERPDKDVGAGVYLQNQASSWTTCTVLIIRYNLPPNAKLISRARKTNWFSAANDPTRTSGLGFIDSTKWTTSSVKDDMWHNPAQSTNNPAQSGTTLLPNTKRVSRARKIDLLTS